MFRLHLSVHRLFDTLHLFVLYTVYNSNTYFHLNILEGFVLSIFLYWVLLIEVFFCD